MLSHQTSPIDPSQRRQQRQQSPIKLEAQNTPHHPTTQQAEQYPESVDSPHMDQLQQFVQQDRMVSITNQGQNQQHYLQVARQHSQARPGQPQHGSIPAVQLSEVEYRNIQHQQLDAQIDSIIRYNHLASPANNEHFGTIERSRSNPELFNGLNIMNIQQQGFAPVQGMFEPGSQPRNLPRNGIVCNDTSTALQPNWQSPQGPYTPPNETIPRFFSTTPIQPLYGYGVYNHFDAPQQDLDHFTVPALDPQATIKSRRSPTHSPSHASIQRFEPYSLSGELGPQTAVRPSRRQSLGHAVSHPNLLQPNINVLPSPPNTAPLKSSRTFDAAALPGSSLDSMPKLSILPSGDGITFNLSQDPPDSNGASPRLSIPPSPMSSCSQQIRNMSLDMSGGQIIYQQSAGGSVDLDHWDLPDRPLSARSMSLADLNLAATIEDTGITAEEVQAYISEPDSVTGKWTCLFEDCKKEFGRRENIRSHVQTHLNDRQFKCVHCGKRFVRQHDLKRHANIHSGVKPYPCRCGNTFARHDALTRHRQRGICNGGFAGVVKKVAKRGRPRKERPDNYERGDKADRTRKRTAEGSTYASSVSGTSEGSFAGSPPVGTFEDVDVTPIATASSQTDLEGFSFHPSVFSQTPPVSPHSHSNGLTPSPRKGPQSDLSATPSSLTLVGEREQEAEFDDSDRAVVEQLHSSPQESQSSTPPELGHTPSSAQFGDLDFSGVYNSSETSNSKADTDFDMFNEQLNDSAQDSFGASFSASTFLNFDKDTSEISMSAFNRGFDDDALFAGANDDSGNGYF